MSECLAPLSTSSCNKWPHLITPRSAEDLHRIVSWAVLPYRVWTQPRPTRGLQDRAWCLVWVQWLFWKHTDGRCFMTGLGGGVTIVTCQIWPPFDASNQEQIGVCLEGWWASAWWCHVLLLGQRVAIEVSERINNATKMSTSWKRNEFIYITSCDQSKSVEFKNFNSCCSRYSCL